MDDIEYFKSIPLSGKQVMELVDGKACVVLYRNLYKFKNIDEVLGKYGACFLLFETEDGIGHWTALYKKNSTVYFFNSYSGYPDDSLSYIDKDYRLSSNQDFPYLSKLLYESRYKLSYNEYRFQGRKSMTCGRWCALFILMRKLPISKFVKLFLKKNGDDIVTLLTLWVNL